MSANGDRLLAAMKAQERTLEAGWLALAWLYREGSGQRFPISDTDIRIVWDAVKVLSAARFDLAARIRECLHSQEDE